MSSRRRSVVALVLAALLTGALAAPAAASHPRPAATVLQASLTIPWDLDFLPGGQLVVTERPGRIRIYASAAPNAALVRTVTVPDIRAEHESGLMGIAVDRDFANHPYIYVCASRDSDGSTGPAPWVNQLLRYRVTPQLDLVAEGTLITDGMRAHTQHNGCAVEMDEARRIWLTMGDGGVPWLAQDPTSLNGKVLRINADGSVPADNPVLDGQSAPSAVYTLGHRNPQGIAFDPASGQPYSVEHGPNRDDEINRLVPGANYGWPCYTGSGAIHLQSDDCGTPTDYSAPAWASGVPTIATSGLAFLDHPTWGIWAGSLVSTTLKEQDLRRFTTPDAGISFAVGDIVFDGAFGRLRAAKLGPDGALYLTTSNGTNDRVLRVVPGDAVIDRIGGADRYATAAAVSAATFASPVPVVYVATGANYPDALAGGAAAAYNRAPVLLVKGNGIPASTAAELSRLRPQRIVVLGGTNVISSGVESALGAYAPFVQRIGGSNRYETAAMISLATFAAPAPAVYVATGENYPDALAGVPAAGRDRAPILLVQRNAIPAATDAELKRLKPQRIVVLGGDDVVSGAVDVQLRGYTTGSTVRRSGADRYQTAVAISAGAFPGRVSHLFVATGVNYPDGLTGGPAAAFRGGPLLLVPGTSLPQAVADEIVRLDPDRVTLLGGTGAVSEDVRNQIDTLLNP